jgi:hypothetical protein
VEEEDEGRWRVSTGEIPFSVANEISIFLLWVNRPPTTLE